DAGRREVPLLDPLAARLRREGNPGRPDRSQCHAGGRRRTARHPVALTATPTPTGVPECATPTSPAPTGAAPSVPPSPCSARRCSPCCWAPATPARATRTRPAAPPPTPPRPPTRTPFPASPPRRTA